MTANVDTMNIDACVRWKLPLKTVYKIIEKQ